jgi:RNA:NAD 2'-phosphotransferase (TPT1/KptA family)
MEKLYHATWKENFNSILCEGIHPGADCLVYMCTDGNDALKFLAIQATFNKKELVVFEINRGGLNESLIQEGMDHSPAFFGSAEVKTYPKTIPPDLLVRYFDVGRG